MRRYRAQSAIAPSRLVVALVSLALFSCGGGSASAPNSTMPPVVSSPATVKDALDFAVDQGADGIWVYIDDGVSPPRVDIAGVANRLTGEPARADAQFKIASISKLFIAVSVTKLVSQGVLTLEDTLVTWLPALHGRIDNADTITIRHLLRHRSGVPDFDSQPGFTWQVAHTNNDALLNLVLDVPADFLPDVRNEYSNSNYLLLGMILDAALGYNHHAFVQSNILTPLGMTRTFSLQSDTDSALLARGFWDDIDRTEQEFVAPGGSMISVVEEVGVFLRALATGSLLSEDERTIYTSLFDVFAHSGWLPGYQSVARYNATTDTVIIQFVNTTGGGSEALAADVYRRIETAVRNN